MIQCSDSTTTFVSAAQSSPNVQFTVCTNVQNRTGPAQLCPQSDLSEDKQQLNNRKKNDEAASTNPERREDDVGTNTGLSEGMVFIKSAERAETSPTS